MLRYLDKIIQDNPKVNQKELLQIWNLGMVLSILIKTTIDEVKSLFPKLYKSLNNTQWLDILTVIHKKSK